MQILWDSDRALIDQIVACDSWLEPHRNAVTAVVLGIKSDVEPQHLSRLIGKDAAAARRAALTRLLTGDPAAWASRTERLAQLRAEAATPTRRAAIDAICACDLSGAVFDTAVPKGALVFPTPALFRGARFAQQAWLNACHFLASADFGDAVFENGAVFELSIFGAPVTFEGARFLNAAEFRKCVFHGRADFSRAQFARDVWLRESRFQDEAVFTGSAFGGEAGLGGCEFARPCRFDSASFAGGAGFDNAVFHADASFADARFEGTAWFREVRFRPAPDFDRARFSGAVKFQGTQIADPRSPHGVSFEMLRKSVGTVH